MNVNLIERPFNGSRAGKRGHMQIDTEICSKPEHHFTGDIRHASYDQIERYRTTSSAYILVLLPLMARWHSSDEFDAEQMLRQMLRQSSRFDYSEPQFFHIRYGVYEDWFCISVGRLNLFEDALLRCEFEHLPKGSAANSMPLWQQKQSSLPLFVLDELFLSNLDFVVTSLYGKLSRFVCIPRSNCFFAACPQAELTLPVAVAIQY